MKKKELVKYLVVLICLILIENFSSAQEQRFIETYNFETNTVEMKKYQNIHQHYEQSFILELVNGKRIERSIDQQIYIVEKGWVKFSEQPDAFKKGNNTLGLVDSCVVNIEISNNKLTGNLYQFETYGNVADNHNYFFNGLLVHNCSTNPTTGFFYHSNPCTCSTPPVTIPPVTIPPVTTPPVTTPPVTTPPVTTPPVATPPVTTPPVATPPVTTPPVATPPVATPPSKCGGCGHESCTCVANAQANLEKAKEVKKIPQSEIERLEVILETAKKNSADKTNTTKSEKDGDPVRIATGEFIVEETDFIFSRLYTSQQQEAGSLGKNWSSSLDSRLIRGVTSGARESVQIIHETAIVPITASYNSTLDSAKYNSGVMESVNSIKTILEEVTQQWESVKKTADDADILKTLNTKVRLHGLPICYEQTGNETITIITENGSPILFNYIGYGIWLPSDPLLAKTTSLKSLNEQGSKSTEGFILTEKGGVKKYFDKYGLLNYIEDRNGNKIIFTRNQSTGVIQSVDTKQGQYICTYDGLYLKSISGPGNQTVLFQYTNGFLTSVTDTDGDTVNYEYIEGQMSRIIKPGLNSFITLTYNDVGSNGRKLATRTSHEEGDCEKFDYYPEENKTVYTNHSGIVTIYYYDGSNRTIREDSSDGTSSTYVYNDVTGYLESQSKFSANYHYDTIIYTYDNIGNKTKALYSDNSSDNWSWNEFCQMTSYTDRDGFRTEWDYDTKGNCTFIYTYSTPISKQKVFTATYFDDGRLKTSKKGNQEVYTYSYDNAGNLKEKSIVINGNTIKEHWISDPVGRIQKYTDGENRTWTYEYPKKSKNANRLVIEKTPDGLEKIYEYNNRKDLVKISEKDTFSLELRTTVIEYDRRHLPIKITNGNGDITEYTYRKDGKIESLKEGVWKQEFTYKEIDGRLETIKKSMNGSLETYTETYTNVLNSTGEIHRLSRPGPHNMSIATDYQYDYWNRITSVENAAEERSTREFSFAGRLLREQTASGGFIIYTYNDSGQLINIGKEDQKAIAVTYNSDGTIATKTDRNNVTTTYEYDGRGLIVREYTLAGEKIYIYDKIDRIIRLEINTKNTAIQGEGTSFTTWDYNDEARTIKITEGDLYETVWEKNAWGEIIKKTDSEGNTFSWAYYGNGKLKSAIDAYGKVTSYTWNALGKINTITNPDATVENYEYNHLGYVIRVSDALGEKWKGTYDEAGRLKSETGRPGIDKKYTYDELDRIISVSSGGEIIEKDAYSTRGTEIHFTDGKGDTYTYTKDEYGELISEKNRNSDMRSYKYDFEGRPVILSQFSGKVETTNYDDNTLKITTTYEDQTTTVITKDYAGRITQVKGSTGTISYYYNAAGKLIRQNDEKAGEETVYKYDGAGRKIKMDSGNREVSYRYGKNGEIVTVEDNKQRLYVNFKYDIMGREISRIYGNGVLQETQYDAIGRTVMIREISATRELIRAEAYLYDYLGRRSHSVDERGNVTRYEYDSQSRLSNVRYPFSEEKSLTDKKEAQEAGNIFSIEHGKAEWYQFTNIESQELREVLNLVSPGKGAVIGYSQTVWKELFTYDKNGNRATKVTPWGTISFKYDKENRLVQKGAIDYTYDKNGNLLNEKGLWKTAEYEYTDANRMKSSMVINIVEKTRTTSIYDYDAIGRRTLVADEGGATMRSLYDGLSFDVIRENVTFNDGSFTSKYKSGIESSPENSNEPSRYRWIDNDNNEGRYRSIDIDGYSSAPLRYTGLLTPLYAKSEAVAMNRSNNLTTNSNIQGGLAYFGTDLLGSVRSVTNSNGTLEDRYEYDAFGKPYKGNFSAGLNVGYTGKPYDPITCMYNYGYRDYSPDIARFTTIDPIRDGNNWFVYVNNDPVNYVDMWGLSVSERNSAADARKMEYAVQVIDQIERITSIISNNTPSNPTVYDSPGGGGTIISVDSKIMDCTAFSSAGTQTKYKSTVELSKEAGYSSSFVNISKSDYSIGDLYVGRYKDGGSERGHVQMNMGNGVYADSVDTPNRSGPSTTTKSTHDYLVEKEKVIVSEVYLRPRLKR